MNTRQHLAGLLLLLTTAGSQATLLQGTVTDQNGTPVFGAMVTLTDSNGHSETVYTGAAGQWQLDTTRQGDLTLRVRAHAFTDDTRGVSLKADTKSRLTTVLARNDRNAQAYSDALPASAHAATLDWQDRGLREGFVSQCQFCHQIGNALTRRPRSEAEWSAAIDRMHGYGALITAHEQQQFPKVLARSFTGAPVTTVLTPDASPLLAQAKVREWSFGAGSNYVHDIELGRDGLIYGVDMGTDLLWILDPKTDAIESIALPPGDLPLGGLFAGAVAPLGTFAAYHGPHSIVEGPDGKLYMTNSLANEIGIYDPATKSFEFVPTGGDTVYPHTLRFAPDGTLWFTFALSNQIGRMDIATRAITVIDLPSNGFWRWLADAMLPTVLEVASWWPKSDLHVTLSHHQLSGEGHQVLNLPYGIDISPLDGSVWYTKLYAGYIGRIDPVTLEVQEFATPYRGPRRARFDANGVLWVPSFEEGYLMPFDTRDKRWRKSYRLPTLAADQYETPYALGVNNAGDGHIWITSNLSDRLFRFDPKTEQFTSYPSPTRVTFMRDIVFTPDGEVCTSNSNLPASAIEGGRPKIVCIRP
jgi:streptogramin lyase